VAGVADFYVDHKGRPFDHPDYEPPCDFDGICEPFPNEEHLPIAMCIWCGGTRYKDHPTPGNWGSWTPDLLLR
jgi:hypothetical protein